MGKVISVIKIDSQGKKNYVSVFQNGFEIESFGVISEEKEILNIINKFPDFTVVKDADKQIDFLSNFNSLKKFFIPFVSAEKMINQYL